MKQVFFHNTKIAKPEVQKKGVGIWAKNLILTYFFEKKDKMFKIDGKKVRREARKGKDKFFKKSLWQPCY